MQKQPKPPVKMRPLNWKKIPDRLRAKTVWKSIDDGAVDGIDTNKLVSLFRAKVLLSRLLFAWIVAVFFVLPGRGYGRGQEKGQKEGRRETKEAGLWRVHILLDVIVTVRDRR